MERRPSVAGQFYPASAKLLEKELSALIDKGAKKEKCLGIVSPHAGYVYSGGVAGKVFSRISLAEHFIIMGPNHTGYGKPFSIMPKGSFNMPQGKVGIDERLAGLLLKNSAHLEVDELAHIHEHSIEVQLPFIQYLLKAFSFVPIVIGQSGLDTYKELGRQIGSAVTEYKKDVIIIASSDMTHYEEQTQAKEKDGRAIEAILKLDSDKLMEMIARYDISICGYAPTIVMMEAAKSLGAKKAELVDYKTSGDASGDYSSVVGYAGIIVK